MRSLISIDFPAPEMGQASREALLSEAGFEKV